MPLKNNSGTNLSESPQPKFQTFYLVVDLGIATQYTMKTYLYELLLYLLKTVCFLKTQYYKGLCLVAYEYK